ncbi:MAG: hypothetical protein JWL62_1552 [Hyphomicrobiales bacterium]|nr:hypothetical protein [Hyphomicrobiales bacterium]
MSLGSWWWFLWPVLLVIELLWAAAIGLLWWKNGLGASMRQLRSNELGYIVCFAGAEVKPEYCGFAASQTWPMLESIRWGDADRITALPRPILQAPMSSSRGA